MARRILVAIDNRDLDAALLEAATRLAAERQAELIGLFVEESDFLSAAGLPMTRLYSVSGGWQALDPDEMRRAFRARAEELRRELELHARRRQISWQLRTLQGSPGEQLLSAASDAELVILGRSRRRRHGPLGSTARRAVLESRAPVLVFDRESVAPDRVIVVYAGDDSVLGPAEEMARSFGVPLHALVLAPDGERGEGRGEAHGEGPGSERGEGERGAAGGGDAARGEEWRRYLEEWLELRGHRTPRARVDAARLAQAQVEVIGAGDAEALHARLERERPAFLVLGAGGDAAQYDLGALLDAVRGPVLVLRGGGGGV